MQIKRFEADDMTEALRMVKREFGDDAVILSAKEMRPGGFFSAFRKKGVEITAAADYPMDDGVGESDFSRQLARQLGSESENDRVSLSGRPNAFIPLSDRPEPIGNPAQSVETCKPACRPVDRSHLQKAALPAESAAEIDPDAVGERLHDQEKKPLTAVPFYRQGSSRRIIALVGAHGTGKSTAVAKLARHCRVVEKLNVALISLDRFRIGANGVLEKVSQIMNIPFAVAHDAEQLQTAMDAQANADVILIDTPGMNGADTSILDNVARLLRKAEPDEAHLVVNPTVRQGILNAWIKTFKPMGIDRLFLTHMDEIDNDDRIVLLIKTSGLPSSFYSDGVDLFDNLKETTVESLEQLDPPTPPIPQGVTDFPAKMIASAGKTSANAYDGDDIHFVANRNSELFHHPDCKSVKRINAENITAFGSLEQALEEGFKPCRACCSEIEMIRKTASGILGHRRVSAI